MEATLIETTLGQLLEAGRLPSGGQFELQDDTVEIALAVNGAVGDSYAMKQAARAAVVTRSVGGHLLTDLVKTGGPAVTGGSIIAQLQEADVQFLSLAWTAVANGMQVAIPQPIPCPACPSHTAALDLGKLIVHARVEGADLKPLNLQLQEAWLPKSLQGRSFFLVPPTWMMVRSRVPEHQQGDEQVVAMYRAMAGIQVKVDDGSPRPLLNTEGKALKLQALKAVKTLMGAHFPRLDGNLLLVCGGCGRQDRLPFDLAAS